MANSPVVLEAVKFSVTTSLPLSHYAHGMTGLYVFGYMTFGHQGYYEPPQYINFESQIIYPHDARPDTVKWQFKPGCSVKMVPVYGNLDAMNPVIQQAVLNLLVGGVTGLAPPGPSGAGLVPQIVRLLAV